MSSAPRFLVNTPAIELWPAATCRARANDTARALASAQTVLRRKRDGRFLAANGAQGLRPLRPDFWQEPGVEEALDALAVLDARCPAAHPLARGWLDSEIDRDANAALGIDADDAERRGLPFQPEPRLLVLAGRDRFRRPLWLLTPAAQAWARLRFAALHDGIVLDAISGFRSHAYQRGIFERKRARGQTLAEILAVNAAPGHSEHHSGRAIDIGTPGEPPAEESFEATLAFAWLLQRAGDFGFALSYPRNNANGITYEPWHWCWHPASG
jgi:D-alanyl-D-alanine carboxypeptidase